MKLINKDSKEDLITSIMNEIEILTSLSHPFIVTLWFAFQVCQCVIRYILLESNSESDVILECTVECNVTMRSGRFSIIRVLANCSNELYCSCPKSSPLKSGTSCLRVR